MKDPKTKDSVYFIVISSEQFSFDIKVYIKNEPGCMHGIVYARRTKKEGLYVQNFHIHKRLLIRIVIQITE